MSRSRSLSTLLWALLLLLVSGAARAESDDARLLVEVARRARASGEYAFAVHALRQAQDLAPGADKLFGIAELYRQQFKKRRRYYELDQAIAYYESYLDEAPTGRHRAAAARARAELARESLPAPDEAELAAAASEEMTTTRIAVLSPQLDASVRLDGGEPQPLPLFREVKPGQHVVQLTASGHRPAKRKLTTAKGFVTAVEIELRPLPAKLLVEGDGGATVHVDGKLVGVLPLDEALELEPGTRSVAVTANGYEPHQSEVTIERGGEAKLAIDLERTDQRIAAAVLLGFGSASLAGGIVFGVFSVIEHRAAGDFAEDAGGPLNPTQQQEYAGYIDRRDDYRLASGITAGVGLGLFLVGGALFILDEPDVPGLSEDVALLPLVAPGLAYGALSVRF